jgi:hypothetical protein
MAAAATARLFLSTADDRSAVAATIYTGHTARDRIVTMVVGLPGHE